MLNFVDFTRQAVRCGLSKQEVEAQWGRYLEERQEAYKRASLQDPYWRFDQVQTELEELYREFI